ncbi:hypothetical protein LO762_06610 [Actinocorallia sp. API 0066]|nr:hypothetical protein [Actinocorallia sp. API 0066]MCD0448860.1 hypothetical protein [Actinocorallia sp. API 0066]
MNAGNVRDGLGTAVPGERTSAANALTRDSIRAAALQARPDEDRASSAT